MKRLGCGVIARVQYASINSKGIPRQKSSIIMEKIGKMLNKQNQNKEK